MSILMNIKSTDVLVIDKIYMLSSKLFIQIEYICRKVRENYLYFGGIQVIGWGDFFQLPPVPDTYKFDFGEFCFKAEIVHSVFRHKVVLKKVMRQDEPDFVCAINNVSKGFHPDETLNLLRRLQRPLPPGEDTITLFGGNFEKEM